MKLISYIFILLNLAGFAKAQIYTDKLKIKLDSLIALNPENEPGGSIHIQQGNQLLYSNSFGLESSNGAKKFSAFTVTNLGTLSKVFIAYSILKLEEQGKLSLEDSLFKFFPDIKNKELAKKIRIRHILTHTSGLKDLPNTQMDSLFSLSFDDKQNFELVKHANKLAFEPGNNFSYSDQAFSSLILIIEKVSKMKWYGFVKETIFAPSGMTFSKLTKDSEINTGVVHGYRMSGKDYVEYDQGECPKMYTAANAGIWSNIEDLRKFMYALKYCLFLKCEAVSLSEQVLTPWNWYTPNPPEHTYCWYANTLRSFTSEETIEYTGSTGGYRSQIIYFPGQDLTIICLSNNGKTYAPTILTQLHNLKFIK